jgi:hypothetical protein
VTPAVQDIAAERDHQLGEVAGRVALAVELPFHCLPEGLEVDQQGLLGLVAGAVRFGILDALVDLGEVLRAPQGH